MLFNLKSLVTGMAILGFSASMQAQTAIDTTECKRQYSLFNEYYKQKNFDMAIEPWRYSFAHCEDLYLGTYVYGLIIYKDLYKKAGEDQKAAYQDTIVQIYDAYLAKIKENPTRFTQYWDYNTVLMGKATDLQILNKDNYAVSYPIFKQSVTAAPDLAGPNTLVFYMQSAMLKKIKGDLSCDSIADLYLTLSEVQEKNFNASKDSSFFKAQSNLDKLAESCLDCEILAENFIKQFATMKNDTNWVRKAAGILDRKKCLAKEEFSSNETIVAIFEANANMNQNADAMFKISSLYVNKKQYGKAEGFIEKAIGLENDVNKKADYYFVLARINFENNKYSEARENAKKAGSLRPNWGEPYIFIGDMYASFFGKINAEDPCLKFGPLWAAADKYNYAKSIDPSSAEKANKQMGRVSGNYPDKGTFFFDCSNMQEGNSVSVGGWISESTTVRTR